jgi:hypothetical protein
MTLHGFLLSNELIVALYGNMSCRVSALSPIPELRAPLGTAAFELQYALVTSQARSTSFVCSCKYT